MPVEIIIRQISILSLLTIIGIIGSGVKVITQASKDFLAGIIFNITLPCMLFTNFSRIDLTPRLLVNSLTVLILTAVIMMLMLMTGRITSRMLRLERGKAGIFSLHSMLGNLVYLGFPVIYSLFGEEGLLYASIFTLVSNILMWTVGVMTISAGNGTSLRKNLRRLVNPNTIAIVTGFILFLLSVKLPGILIDSLGGLGSTNSYLSMLYIGAVLYYASVKTILSEKSVYLLSFNKLVFIPFILIAVFSVINKILPGRVDILVESVLVMLSAMPCMVNVVILVNILGGDDKIATANVFVTTILSIVTLPLVLLGLRLL